MREHKRRFLRHAVIGFGFFSGLWVHLGFDPSSFVYAWLQRALLAADPTHAALITATFLALPTVLTCFTLLVTYHRGGWFGLLAVALAYAAGLALSLLSVPLLVLAVLIGLIAAKR